MKKILSVSLILTLLLSTLCILPAGAAIFSNSIISTEYFGNYWYIILDDGTVAIGNNNPDITGTIVIPPTIDGYTVTEIANSGFESTSITGVIIPDTVKHINDYAFSYCNKLKNVTVPDSVTSMGEAVFRNCDNLKEIFIPASVTDIGLCAIGYEDFYIMVDGVKEYDGGYNHTYGVTIEGYSGTAAESYAKENHCTFIDVTPKYKDQVLALLDIPEEDLGTCGGWLAYYREEYEYYSAPSANTATPDYVLIETYENVEGPAFAAKIFGDYVLRSYSHRFPATFGYFIYLPETNEIYSLQKAFEMGLEGVYYVFTEGGIGELIGDVNYDGELNIRDATLIQKHLADIEKIEHNEIDAYPWSDEPDSPAYIGDFNRDGKMNIRDATAIQKRLAGLDFEEIEYTVLGITRLSHPTDKHVSVKAVARSSEELMSILSKVTDNSGVILHDKQLDEEYFKEKNVIVIAEVLGGICGTKTFDSVKSNGTALKVQLTNHYSGVCLDEVIVECVLIEVDKADTDSVLEIEVRESTALLCP